jgi:hypothetical protein
MAYSTKLAAEMSQVERNPTPSSSKLETTSTPEKTSTEIRDIYSKEGDLEAVKLPVPNTDDEKTPKDPNLVTWDGPQDPENPKNWPNKVKWRYTVAVSVFTFISPVSSAMIAPALSKMGADLHMHSDLEVELALSIFLLAYAVGPLFFGPASELYGRMRLLQLSNLWYMVWNLVCGFAQNPAELFVFRFLAGIGGSAPLALGGGAIR